MPPPPPLLPPPPDESEEGFEGGGGAREPPELGPERVEMADGMTNEGSWLPANPILVYPVPTSRTMDVPLMAGMVLESRAGP